MPLKGYHRVGGPNATLTELGFGGSGGDLILAAGTVISGPTDTSRYENDVTGNPFWMPYSTTVYADGQGGTYPVETWGLQYLPAGWITYQNSGPWYQTALYSSFYELQNSMNVQVLLGSFNEYYWEDGTGISVYVNNIQYNVSENEVLATTGDYTYWAWSEANGSYQVQAYRVRARWYQYSIVYDDYTMYPVGGTTVTPANGGYNYIDTPCGQIQAGDWYSAPSVADGFGGSYSGGNSYSNYLPNGTYLQECNGDYLYANGGNGYYTGYAPYGTPWSYSYSSSFNWVSPDGGQSGSFTYSWGGSNGIWDGNGNTISQGGGGATASSGDTIGYGSYYTYDYYDYYDIDGNGPFYGSTQHYFTWSYTYNGNAYYNSNINQIY